jgi:hypothetical protein
MTVQLYDSLHNLILLHLPYTLFSRAGRAECVSATKEVDLANDSLPQLSTHACLVFGEKLRNILHGSSSKR